MITREETTKLGGRGAYDTTVRFQMFPMKPHNCRVRALLTA